MRTPAGSDERLPPHKRRTGRMESLHEFQQRARSYEGSDRGQASPPPLGDVFVQLPTTPRPSRQEASHVSHASSETMRPMRLSRHSTASLFGNLRRTSKSVGSFYRHQLKVLTFLVLLGVIGGPLSFCVRELYGQITALRLHLLSLTSNSWLQFALWTAHIVTFSQLAVLWTSFAPAAAGSGVSQMKSVLTGVDPRVYIPGYFDTTTLIAKLAGLVCSVGAGLIVGTEGAFVHIMAIITHHLLQVPCFAGFCLHLNARLQLLAAACAVGVASTFSSPIGGVLFSMEVTSTYYLISNYMKAFISSVSGALMLQISLSLAQSSSRERGSSSILKARNQPESFASWELPLFVVLGVLIGIVCSGMVALLRVLAAKRKRLRALAASSDSRCRWSNVFVRWLDPLIVAIITATLTYWPGDFLHARALDELTVLFTADALPASWHHVSPFYSLGVLALIYALLLPMCITLRVPTGVWLPTFVAGAALGRLFGECLDASGSPSLRDTISPGTYALAGAAAFAGAATRTVSAAVITIEITGSIPLMLPIFCCVLTAIAVANLFPEQSVYDTLLLVSGLPYLPLVDFDPKMTAGDIIEPQLVFVTKRTTIAKLLLAVQRLPDHDIPVVYSEADMRLLGLVSGVQVKKLIRYFYQTHHLPDVDVDLGEATTAEDAADVSWTTIATQMSRNRGGFYGDRVSYGQAYHALSTTVHGGGASAQGLAARMPFLMDDDKMIGLMARGWSDEKRERLSQTIKLSLGHFCVLKPMALTVSSATSLDDLHMIFTMLRCDHCYVCDQGALTGVVTTSTLLSIGALE
ncbi:hypothetical protein P43SY_006355 [Pythium insidiosum]|uniref:Chloride channel protein n=1 Tax=Pythium insidiosum TaxID=114742 RepID=A0AAD5LH31_PYTIN|nr:hypothetical protein P43SY_006355 [Pythium insidiosum]